jgi:hypothetical protein
MGSNVLEGGSVNTGVIGSGWVCREGFAKGTGEMGGDDLSIGVGGS